MIKSRHYRHNVFLLTLVMVCAACEVCAQDNFPGPITLPVIIDRKQAAGLLLTQPPPEYPTVAKVNYLQGPVQLEITVNGTGKVAKVHVLGGNAILAASALKAALRWIYHPLATTSGPSGFITTVEMKFALNYHGIELTPRQAELDFLRQVKLPQVVQPPDKAHSGDSIHMRLLVNDQGQVIDMDISPMGRARFEAARETLRGWIFRPAHWGSLPVASYLDVDVPVGAQSLASTTTTSSVR